MPMIPLCIESEALRSKAGFLSYYGILRHCRQSSACPFIYFFIILSPSSFSLCLFWFLLLLFAPYRSSSSSSSCHLLHLFFCETLLVIEGRLFFGEALPFNSAFTESSSRFEWVILSLPRLLYKSRIFIVEIKFVKEVKSLMFETLQMWHISTVLSRFQCLKCLKCLTHLK